MKDKYEFRERIASRLVKLRKEKGISQAQLCRKLSISPKTYSAYEERRAEPSTGMLMKIAEYYQITIDEIVKAKYLLKI